MRNNILIALLILLAGITFFWVGFHNFDNAQNIEKLTLENNYGTYHETKLNGETISLGATYLMGLRQTIMGFFITILGSMMLGISLGELE